MKKNIFIKVIFAILISTMLININKYVFATNTKESAVSNTVSIDGFMGDAKNFIKDGEKEGETVFDKTGLKSISDVVYNTLLAVGMVAAVAVGIFLGIKIMMASTEEQATYKEMLIPYFIGCIVIFGAFGIWKIVVNILQSTV